VQRGIRRLIVLLTVFAFWADPLATAFDWPVGERFVLQNFGQSTSGGFLGGIVLGGEGQPVRAIAEGEVVFAYREGRPTSFPRAMGTFLALQHEGDVQSVYGHLIDPVRATHIRGGETIGRVGDTGSAQGPRLVLMIADAREGRLLNPIEVGKSPLQPQYRPEVGGAVIERVELEVGENRLPLPGTTTVPAGTVGVLVTAYHLSDHGTFAVRTAPFRLSVARSGQIVAEVRLDALRVEGGDLVLAADARTHDSLYASPWTYRVGEMTLVEGRTQLEVRVEGYARRPAVATFDLTVARN
jgi:hypothetical protein